MKCLHCNLDVPANAKFCPSCGQKIGCPSCGFKDIMENMKFCPECGTKLIPEQSNTTDILPAQETPVQKRFTNYFLEKDFEQYINLLVENLNIIENYRDSSPEIAELFTIDFDDPEQEFSLCAKTDLPKNPMKLKDSLMTYMSELLEYKFVAFNHFIASTPNFRNQSLLVNNDFIKNYKANFFIKNSAQCKNIDYELPECVNNIAKLVALIKDRDAKDDSSGTKTALMAGAAGVATFLSGGLAAPLLLAAGTGTSYIMDKKAIENIQSNIDDVRNALKNNLHSLATNHEKLRQSIFSEQLESVRNDLPKALVDISNNIVNSGQTDYNSMLMHIRNYVSKFISNISEYKAAEVRWKKISEENERYMNHNFDRFCSASALSDDARFEFMFALYDRGRTLLDYLSHIQLWENSHIKLDDIFVKSIRDIEKEYTPTGAL